MNLLLIIMIGVSLSLDAFSLSITYGLMNIDNKKIVMQSLIVGLFHFFMPILGIWVGDLILDIIKIDSKYLVTIIFSFIIISILKNIKEEEKSYNLTIPGMILFAFAVSIDSFSIGISLKCLSSSIILGPSIFFLFSSIITYIGFKIGKYINEKIGIISKVISACLLTTVCFYIICH